MAEITMHVPKKWPVSYKNAEGEAKTMLLSSVCEYKVTTDDGAITYLTLNGIRNDETSGGTMLLGRVIMKPGKYGVMTRGNTLQIDASKIVSIEQIFSAYVSDTTPNKNRYPKINPERFITFVFDSDRFSNQYRITVMFGEFVAVSLENDKDGGRNLKVYGQIDTVNKKNGDIHMTRFLSNNGVRSVVPYTINIEDVLGVFRYDLVMENAEEHTLRKNAEEVARKERKEKIRLEREAAQGAAEAEVPAEEAAQETPAEEPATDVTKTPAEDPNMGETPKEEIPSEEPATDVTKTSADAPNLGETPKEEIPSEEPAAEDPAPEESAKEIPTE